ncbi:hypothetical protein FFT09_18370 [Saccharomonospora piscinae]|uniref:hypothetical protein n=1 Tax=Saccharomonospora piscinae TaxID=687388 RepID=UPI001106CB94|nr:hypothetical protein [Saccharomonospora piscinae]TLW91225.1 hypothetical protein FFT09_18370 [Saccharomonospora piscinae]
MTDNHELAPEADVTEQRLSASDGADADTGGADALEQSLPMEANPADVAEQATVVPLEDDDEFRADS